MNVYKYITPGLYQQCQRHTPTKLGTFYISVDPPCVRYLRLGKVTRVMRNHRLLDKIGAFNDVTVNACLLGLKVGWRRESSLRLRGVGFALACRICLFVLGLSEYCVLPPKMCVCGIMKAQRYIFDVDWAVSDGSHSTLIAVVSNLSYLRWRDCTHCE